MYTRILLLTIALSLALTGCSIRTKKMEIYGKDEFMQSGSLIYITKDEKEGEIGLIPQKTVVQELLEKGFAPFTTGITLASKYETFQEALASATKSSANYLVMPMPTMSPFNKFKMEFHLSIFAVPSGQRLYMQRISIRPPFAVWSDPPLTQQILEEGIQEVITPLFIKIQ